MSVTNKSPYVSFHMNFVPIKGSFHYPYPTSPLVGGFLTSRYPLLIGSEIHHGVLSIHCDYHFAVNTVSANMWWWWPWVARPFKDPPGKRENYTPKTLIVITNKVCPYFYSNILLYTNQVHSQFYFNLIFELG